MSLIERAWLYITRKKGKTLVMFCILFVMASAIISGFSIKKAAQTAMQQARESVGGSFSMGINYDESNSNIKRTEERDEFGAGVSLENVGLPLSEKVAEQVAKLDGIKGMNGTGMARLDEAKMKYLEPDKSSTSSSGLSISGGGNTDIMNVQFSIDMYSELDALFQNGTVKLAEGRHLKKEDQQKVLVHKEFAKKNGWKLGDKISLRLDEESRKANGVDGTYYDCEIIGLFENTSKVQNNAFLPFMMPENNIIADVDTGKKLIGKDEFEFENLTFYVKDPKKIDDIVNQVKKLDIDWDQFALDTNDAQYQQIAGSIENLDGMITTILYAVFIVSCIILTLILSLWIKGRIYETGVLLSIGISKNKIIMQYISELMIIAILAFGLSFLSGTAISQGINDSLIASIQSQNQDDGMGGAFSVNSVSLKGGAFEDAEAIEELDVSIALNELGLVYVLGSGLIILSVILSSASLLRLKPKEILSKMS